MLSSIDGNNRYDVLEFATAAEYITKIDDNATIAILNDASDVGYQACPHGHVGACITFDRVAPGFDDADKIVKANESMKGAHRDFASRVPEANA